MSPNERTLLTNFLSELVSARAGMKDADANAMINQALAANPDSAYLLVQHALVADQSLHAAQQRIAELERQQTVAAPAASSFLPQANVGPWGARPTDAYSPPPPDQRPGLFSSGGGLGSFLRSAGTTAAGVVGGEMLFSGLSDMFGHHGGGGMFSGGGQGFGGGSGETIINNYGSDDVGSDDYSGDSSDMDFGSQ